MSSTKLLESNFRTAGKKCWYWEMPHWFFIFPLYSFHVFISWSIQQLIVLRVHNWIWLLEYTIVGLYPVDILVCVWPFQVDEGEAPVPNISSSMSKTVSLPIVHESSMIRTESWAINSYHKQSHFHPFSDTDITPLVRWVVALVGLQSH